MRTATIDVCADERHGGFDGADCGLAMVFRGAEVVGRLPAMALDLEGFPAPLKKKLIALGEQFGSQDTLDQANQTLNALGKHAGALAGHGFVAADQQRLAEARDLLIEAGVGRDAAKGQKKTTSAAFAAAMGTALTARLSARSVLDATHGELEESGNDAAAQAAEAVLKQTVVAPVEAESLAKQLDALRAVLGADGVSAAAAERGGSAAVTALQAAANGLRAADKADTGVRGTPMETQRLDLLDGIIVRLVRRARRAAVAAGKAKGDAALAAAFRLDRLYQSRGGSAGDEGEGEAEAPKMDDGAGKGEP